MGIEYKKTYSQLQMLARECEKSVVTVIGISEQQDWFAGTTENENTTAGLIVAENGVELLIMADAKNLKNASVASVLIERKKNRVDVTINTAKPGVIIGRGGEQIEVMKKESNLPIVSLKVDGGATSNQLLMQFQSDILETTIKLPKCLETTALGVAYLAGLNSGYYKNLQEIIDIHTFKAEYKPYMSKTEIKQRYSGWKKAIKATRIFK